MVHTPTFLDLTAKLKQLRDKGDYSAALNLSKYLTIHFPMNVGSWLNASDILDIVGNFEMSIFCLKKALELTPNEPITSALLASAYARNDDIANALQLANKLLETKNCDDKCLSILGNVFSYCDEQQKAFFAFERALSQSPDNLEHKYNLANSYRFLGESIQAEELFDEIISACPSDGDAILTRSRLRKQTEDNNHITWLENQLHIKNSKQGLNESIQFALAKEYEDLENVDKSFLNLKSACVLRRRNMNYDVNKDIESIDCLVETFSQDFATESNSNYDNSEAIFITGLPRSGTTLTERILDSHSLVKSAGELRQFSNQLQKLVKAYSGITKGQSYMDIAHKVDPSTLGKCYIESTRPRTGHTPFFIDKMPQNYMNIGFIFRSLPNAKVVLLERNPMDTCYALYKAYFKTGVRFSYDLNELGQYYLSYTKLINFWKQIFPDRIHSVTYEKVIEETENEARKLINYCGLEWESECLEFYKNKSPSSTASSSQVRRPIYKSSLNKWLKYREHLKPLETMLVKAGIDIGI